MKSVSKQMSEVSKYIMESEYQSLGIEKNQHQYTTEPALEARKKLSPFCFHRD